MEDIRNVHQVVNKLFCSLFSTQSVKTYDVIQSDKLGLSHIQFEGLEENWEKLKNFGKVSPQIRGTEGGLIVDVPGKGDCSSQTAASLVNVLNFLNFLIRILFVLVPKS